MRTNAGDLEPGVPARPTAKAGCESAGPGLATLTESAASRQSGRVHGRHTRHNWRFTSTTAELARASTSPGQGLTRQ